MAPYVHQNKEFSRFIRFPKEKCVCVCFFNVNFLEVLMTLSQKKEKKNAQNFVWKFFF